MEFFFSCDDCCRFSTVCFIFFSILFLIAFALASLFLFSLALVWLFNTLCLCCFAVVYDDFQDKCYSRSVKIKKWRYRKTHTSARVSTYIRSRCLAFESSDVYMYVCTCVRLLVLVFAGIRSSIIIVAGIGSNFENVIEYLLQFIPQSLAHSHRDT